jgi:hypothetical protein
MYLNMYRAVPTILGDAASPEMTVRERRQPWMIWQASGAGRDDGKKKKFPSRRMRVALSIDVDGNDATTSPAYHPPRSERQEPVAGWPTNTPRHEAAGVRQRPAKERREAGGKKLGGLEHSAHAVLATTNTSSPAPGHHHHRSPAAPGRLRTRISPPPFEGFGESS